MNITKLREILLEEIQNLRTKKSTPREVNAIVNAAGKFLFSIKLELDYVRLKGGKPTLLALERVGGDVELA